MFTHNRQENKNRSMYGYHQIPELVNVVQVTRRNMCKYLLQEQRLLKDSCIMKR